MALDLSTLTPEEAITAFYIGYYERAADPAGLAFWTDVLELTSLDLAAIASDFASQDETLDAHPFFSNPTEEAAGVFIAELYLNLFERADVDAEGLQFWTDVLLASINGDEGALSIGEIIIQIISGAQDTAAGNDRTTILNKIEVATSFTAAADAEGITAFAEGSDVRAQSMSIIENVTSEGSTVVAAKNAISDFFTNTGGGDGGVPGEFFILEEGREVVDGTDGNDTFEAFNDELQDGDRVNGGSGRDVLTYFNSVDGVAKSPITTGVEQFVITNQMNDLESVADNNVGGYSTSVDGFFFGSVDETVEVDVEIDGGMMSGITRWENHDSRADVVIEDARDLDDTDGTFTGDITVAMVSTDPGNVDYAVYFDGPTNTAQNFGTIELRVLDQEAATGLPAPSASSTGYLTEASLIEFTFEYNGQSIRVELADEQGVTYGPNVTFQDLREQIEAATAEALEDAGITGVNAASSFGAPVSVGVGNQFTLPIILTFDVPADTITANPNNVIVLGRDSGNNNATDTFGALSTDRQTVEELIRLNVELDDVGKGSMGGDAMFGAMSTGRQTGDDGTSDSIGIQQFDIEVDRSSKLQTIASTNNALQVVNIANGENNGPNNTTTAADEQIGDLTVRGVANPGIEFSGDTLPAGTGGTFDIVNDARTLGAIGNTPSGITTDGPMPGAVPQHNIFGFTDVREINAATMVGAVDLTVGLTEEIVEKYLDIQDGQANGEADDVDFTYNLGTNNDEFFLNMSSDALNAAGTGSREDFDMSISGGAGADVITTNIGEALKVIDEQGQDFYAMATENGGGSASWYTNAVSNVAAEFSVSGGAGADTIWTHGWGDFTIDGGADADVIYTDNSGAELASLRLATNIDRNLTEHDQIDYVVGGVWAFNGDNVTLGTNGALSMTGATNDEITLGQVADVTTNAPLTATSGQAVFTVSYLGASGTAGTAYTINITIPFSELTVNSTNGVVTTTEQALNQAIKAGINGDAILSNLLEAADGPGNSLLVASKTDGTHVAADLALGSTYTLSINTTTAVPQTGETFTTNAAYTTPGFINLGTASTAESDNLIKSGSDGANDLIVLSTSDTEVTTPAVVNGTLLAATDLNGASNEVIEFDNGFGRDTILNFDAAGTGTPDGVNGAEDVLDFDLLFSDNSFLPTAVVVGPITGATVNGEVTIAAETTAIDTLAEIQAIYAAADTAATTARAEELVIVFDTADDNAGAVYSVVNGTGVGDVTVAFEGTINLIGTDWTTLGLDNFA
jgi:hypothetical protein